MTISKEPVRLRKRLMPSGLTSLYLDIYNHGKRKYEYLKLYLVPETGRKDREKNRETLRLAEDIKAKRLVELRNGEFGFRTRGREDVPFYGYFRMLAESKRKEDSVESMKLWMSCLQHLTEYDGNEKLSVGDITQEWVCGFRDFLKGKGLAPNSVVLYYSKLQACLNKAVNDGLIMRSPARGVENPKGVEVERMYLTVGELKQLAATECGREEVKRAFLFSCLTGLRWSDVTGLTWGDVQQGDYTRVVFRQKKTGGQEYLDIPRQAVGLMGTRGEAGARVFGGMPCRSYMNDILLKWVRAAGIEKHITFHCARHTFAVMMLDLGTDIYTVSKLLGHRKLTTTQVYAKVLDKNKQAAVARIPRIIG